LDNSFLLSDFIIIVFESNVIVSYIQISSDIIEFISKKDKEKSMSALLKSAADNRKRVENYKFSREECYDK
jgi:hypothetical protein